MRLPGLPTHAGLALTALSLLPVPAFATAPPASRDMDAVLAMLRRDSARPEPTREELAADLSALGPRALPDLYGIWSGEGLERLLELEGGQLDASSWWCPPDELGPLVLSAMGDLPAEDVVPFLARRIEASEELEDRIVAVRVLSELGSPEGLQLLVEVLLDAPEPLLRYRSVRTPLCAAFGRSVRDESAIRNRVSRALAEAPASRLSVIAEGIAQSGRAEGAWLLWDLLRDDPVWDRQVFAHLASLEAQSPWLEFPDYRLELEHLLHDHNTLPRRQALASLAKLRDPRGALDALRGLDDEDAGVRRSSLAYLRALSGLTLDETSQTWWRWFDAETEWARTELNRTLDHLRAPTVAERVEALAALRGHGLHAHEIATRISEQLPHLPDDTTPLACQVLAELGSRLAVPALAERLSSTGTDGTHLAAWSSLRELTGYDLPADAGVWAEVSLTGTAPVRW